MAQVIMKRGTSAELTKEIPYTDGLLSFITDTGEIYMDYSDASGTYRKKMYGGKLTFGSYEYDGTSDVNVTVYKGETN